MLQNTQKLLEIMAQLRNPNGGCSWDIQQNFSTIAPYTIEEAYEVADAIDKNDMQALKEELGDLLLQVVFHSQMAQEKNIFSFEDVATEICEKLVRRHPHVFGGADPRSAEQQLKEWEMQKAAERAEKAKASGEIPSVLSDVAVSLPAIIRAQKLQKRAASVGFDWPEVYSALDKLDEEIDELENEIESKGSAEKIAEEMGDILFSCVNVARHLGVDAEEALKACNIKFEQRFKYVEAAFVKSGRDIKSATLAEMDEKWEESKGVK